MPKDQPPNDQLQGSTPNFSNIRIAVSATENDGTIRGDHDQPEGSHPGNLSSSSTLKDDAAEQRTRLRDRISELFRRSPSPNRRNQSSTPQPNYPVTETSPNGPRPLLSPLPTEVIPTALVGDDEASVGTQQEPSDIGPLAPAASSVTAESASRRSDGNRKDIIAGGTKAFLQTAATALKFVPIPNLDQIPNTLLTWIRIYEVREWSWRS
ncbi:uncharacterized protein EI90DRAFT_422600 [Cantharellus anzutake]|uniref:uncharacterized protein n=1 Tax=Cantharellus anzutake TaxID=1750568 RepID=UPI0019083756|nr:uncharacterized protein EI90DRAFT_422600 [Cantharellus anzutake]KAF8314621.1 hypothetical protein EI90DRAFT_422600 [Cantharellus anzutake]